MKASRVMTVQVVHVDPNTSLRRADQLMREHRFRHLPVTTERVLCGILSDRDVLAWSARGPDGTSEVPEVAVAQVMTKVPITCPPSAPISRIAGLMLEHRIDCVPIVAPGGELLGLVTSSDLIALLREPEQISDVLPFSFALRTPDELTKP